MAIDTETKRRTVIGNLPVATGTIGVGERRQVLFIYPFDGEPFDPMHAVEITFTLPARSTTFEFVPRTPADASEFLIPPRNTSFIVTR